MLGNSTISFEIHFSLDKAKQTGVLGLSGCFLCSSGPQAGVLGDHLGSRSVTTMLGYAGGSQSTYAHWAFEELFASQQLNMCLVRANLIIRSCSDGHIKEVTLPVTRRILKADVAACREMYLQ